MSGWMCLCVWGGSPRTPPQRGNAAGGRGTTPAAGPPIRAFARQQPSAQAPSARALSARRAPRPRAPPPQAQATGGLHAALPGRARRPRVRWVCPRAPPHFRASPETAADASPSPLPPPSTGEQDAFYSEWEEACDSFDQMGLHESLLRGIYAVSGRGMGGKAAGRRPEKNRSTSGGGRFGVRDPPSAPLGPGLGDAESACEASRHVRVLGASAAEGAGRGGGVCVLFCSRPNRFVSFRRRSPPDPSAPPSRAPPGPAGRRSGPSVADWGRRRRQRVSRGGRGEGRQTTRNNRARRALRGPSVSRPSKPQNTDPLLPPSSPTTTVRFREAVRYPAEGHRPVCQEPGRHPAGAVGHRQDGHLLRG